MDAGIALISMIVAGFMLCAVYFYAEYLTWRRQKAKDEQRAIVLVELQSTRMIGNRALDCTFATAGEGDAPPTPSLTAGLRVTILGTVDQVSDDSVILDVPARSEPVGVVGESCAAGGE